MARPYGARQRAEKTVARLKEIYPVAICELDFKTPYQLLVATILSAQSTDKMVNSVTPKPVSYTHLTLPTICSV